MSDTESPPPFSIWRPDCRSTRRRGSRRCPDPDAQVAVEVGDAGAGVRGKADREAAADVGEGVADIRVALVLHRGPFALDRPDAHGGAAESGHQVVDKVEVRLVLVEDGLAPDLDVGGADEGDVLRGAPFHDKRAVRGGPEHAGEDPFPAGVRRDHILAVHEDGRTGQRARGNALVAGVRDGCTELNVPVVADVAAGVRHPVERDREGSALRG